jgi:hypothetical protein
LAVVDVAPQLLNEFDNLFKGGALAVQRLRFLGIIPEPRCERALAELVYFVLKARDVKDAPLAS